MYALGAKEKVGEAYESLDWPALITQVVCPLASVPASDADNATLVVIPGT